MADTKVRGSEDEYGALYVGPPDEPDRYRIASEEGRGAQGVLWLAHARLAGGQETRVAVKQLISSSSINPDLWQEQYNLLAAIESVAIARVTSMFFGATEHRKNTYPVDHPRHDARTPYQVMSWAQGQNLNDWLMDNGATTRLSGRLRLLTAPASGLDALHGLDRTNAPLTGARWVAHGDVKPGNIVVSNGENPVVKLVDFGCTRIAQSPPTTMHTAQYSPPWIRVPGLAGTPVADRYALLCTLAHVILGTSPPAVYDSSGDAQYVDVAELIKALEAQLAERPALLDALAAQLTAEVPTSARPDNLAPISTLLAHLRDAATSTKLPVKTPTPAPAPSPVPVGLADAATTKLPEPPRTTPVPAPAPVRKPRLTADERWRRQQRRRRLKRTAAAAAVAAGLVAFGLGPGRPTVHSAILSLESLGKSDNTGTSASGSDGGSGVTSGAGSGTPATSAPTHTTVSQPGAPVVEHTTPPVVVPNLTSSTAAKTVSAGDIIQVAYSADRLGSGEHLLLQRSVDGGGWVTVKTLSDRSGRTSTQVPMGKKTYRVAAVDSTGKTLSSATAGTVYSFGTVPLQTLLSSHERTVTVGTSQFRYVFSGNAQSLFWNEGPDGNKAWDVTSSACRRITLDVAGTDAKGDGNAQNNETFLRITRENADAATVLVPMSTIQHLNASVTPGTSWAAVMGGSYFMYINGSASCWSTSGFTIPSF